MTGCERVTGQILHKIGQWMQIKMQDKAFEKNEKWEQYVMSRFKNMKMFT